MNEIQLFDKLRKETRKEFLKSTVYKNNKDENWNYAICETPIQKGKGIIFGLNPGGKNIDAQSAYPKGQKKRNWNFVTHSMRYFRDYLNINDIWEANYSNLCFFRSPKIRKMTKDDWNLAIPLFKQYVDYIQPSWTILLGKTGMRHLRPNYLTDEKAFIIHGKSKRTFVYTGKLFGEYPFACVPHPQTRISRDVRIKSWDKVVKENKLIKI